MTQSYDQESVMGVDGAHCRVEIEPDATPFARWIGARLRAATRAGRHPTSDGSVLVRATHNAQNAVVAISPPETGGRILVTRGPAATTETLSVSTEDDLCADAHEGMSPLARQICDLLAPCPASWRDAAVHFWEANTGTPGMPVAVRLSSTRGEELVLGHGEPEVGIAGTPESLRRVLTGSAQLDDAIRRGEVSFHGTLRCSQ